MKVGMAKWSEGDEFEAYITEREATCPKCGKTVSVVSSVSKDVADSRPDPMKFVELQNTAFFQNVNQEYMAKHCDAASGTHNM